MRGIQWVFGGCLVGGFSGCLVGGFSEDLYLTLDCFVDSCDPRLFSQWLYSNLVSRLISCTLA